MQKKVILGPTAKVYFPELSSHAFSARIDTGAETSAICFKQAEKTKQGLKVIFFNDNIAGYSEQPFFFNEYIEVNVVSSNSIKERRYKLQLNCTIADLKFRAWFTLSDRSQRRYPVLVGRNILNSNFIVDVSIQYALEKDE